MDNNEDLLSLILKYSWIKDRGKLNFHTRLEEDLRMYGEDAEEFLCDYSEKITVDISGFNFSKYFTNEPFFFYDFIVKWFCRNKKTDTLTIRDLEKGILAGRLDDDVLSRKTE